MDLKKVINTYSLPLKIKPGGAIYFIFAILLFLPAIISLFATLKNPSFWPIIGISLVVFILFLIWIYNFEIQILKDRIIYKSLFRKEEILFENIKKVEIIVGIYSNRKAKNSGYYSLNIFNTNQKISINMKPFSRRDLAIVIVIDSIYSYNKSIELNELAMKLKDGNFKPIVMQGIKKVWEVALLIFVIFLVIGLINALIK